MDIDLISTDRSCFEFVTSMCDRLNMATVISPSIRPDTEHLVKAIEISEA